MIALLVAVSLWLGFAGARTESAQPEMERNKKNQTAAATATDLDVKSKKRANYPKEWEVEIPKGTKLEALQKELDQQLSILPERDLEDRTPIPIWFRVYLRKLYPQLPTSGPYQYPRTAQRILQRMLDKPDSVSWPEPEQKNR